VPIDIQRQLLMERDPHGNVKLSMIETEKLLIELLVRRLAEMRAEGKFKGKFAWQAHFLGYEGRCAAPTNFDADYAYALGLTAVALAKSRVTGYMTVVKNLAQPHREWEALGVPLTLMMNLEQRGSGLKPVIEKGLVSLQGEAFKKLLDYRESWAMKDDYRFSGAIQYFGPPEITDLVPKTLTLESKANKKHC
jgi:pyrophosphate--fructose-6-phosphate 1-phosphotransferase